MDHLLAQSDTMAWAVALNFVLWSATPLLCSAKSTFSAGILLIARPRSIGPWDKVAMRQYGCRE
jgi:hypothetical protein